MVISREYDLRWDNLEKAFAVVDQDEHVQLARARRDKRMMATIQLWSKRPALTNCNADHRCLMLFCCTQATAMLPHPSAQNAAS
jgi:hypothetical protein